MSRLTEAIKEAGLTAGRGTGRTTRMLQAALAAAKQGGVVYVVGWDAVHTRKMQGDMVRFKELQALGPNTHVGLHTGDIQLPHPMGQIRFRSTQVPDWDWERLHFKGIPQAIPVYVDHWVYECKLSEMNKGDKK